MLNTNILSKKEEKPQEPLKRSENNMGKYVSNGLKFYINNFSPLNLGITSTSYLK